MSKIVAKSLKKFPLPGGDVLRFRWTREDCKVLKILSGVERGRWLRYTNKADHSAHYFANLSSPLVSIV